ncbi:MAG: DUF2892 domain-containing protein [Arcicella sp.]|jgi:hypothetical protein|nr:DUF2892 domain-containing protein [Arcicella sp.]
MKKNMGGTDRIIRIVVALIALVLFFTNTISGTLGIVVLALSGIFLLTSFMSFCPLYTIVGISTCSIPKK